MALGTLDTAVDGCSIRCTPIDGSVMVSYVQTSWNVQDTVFEMFSLGKAVCRCHAKCWMRSHHRNVLSPNVLRVVSIFLAIMFLLLEKNIDAS